LPALDTVGDYLTESRVLLQDTIVPYRYSDAEMVSALNIALLEVRRLRADLLLSVHFDIPYFSISGTIDKTAKVPFEPMYRGSLVYYVVGRMQLRDDEATTDSRAASLLGKFMQQMLTVQS
jgi:hypothetical protein